MSADRTLDPELRLQHARDLAYRSLGRRDRTELEIRTLLADKRVAPEEIETVVAELVDQNYLDDARFAERFAEDQRNLQDWGPDRIARKLRSLGIASDLIDAALQSRSTADELDAAVALLRRRLGRPPETLRERDRALGILVRKGYDLELARDALRRFAGVAAEL